MKIMNICLYYTLFRTTHLAITPNGIFVAPLKEFLKYMRCSIILEGCNETLHNGVTELHNESSMTLLGEYDS